MARDSENRDYGSLLQNLQNVIGRFRYRMGWRDFSKLLKSNKMPSAKNYDALVKKLNSIPYSDKQRQIFEEFVSQVGHKSLLQNIVAGSKAILFYKLSDDEKEKLHKHLKKCKRDGLNVFNKSLEGQNLSDVLEFEPSRDTKNIDTLFQDHTFKAQIEEPEQIHFIYETKRVVEFKEQIPAEVVNKEMGKVEHGYTEVIGVSRFSMVAFDTITINKDSNIIELRIDYYGGIQKQFKEKIFSDMETKLREILSHAGITKNLTPVNLFSLVDKMLEDEGSGRVVELHFITNQGNTKIHKSRKESAGCLYKDNYHNAGKLKVLFDAYRIAKRWKVKQENFESEPELFIPGAYKMLGAGRSHPLNYLVILDSIKVADFSFIMNKVYEHLK